MPSPWWKMDYYELRYEDQNENKNIFINLMERGLGMKFMSSFPVFLTNDIALCALGKMNV